MQGYKVQTAYTFEFVTASTHDDWDEAQDSATEQIQLHGEDRVRIVRFGDDD